MVTRSKNFAEIKSLFESGDDSVTKYRLYYSNQYGRDTDLEDDDIIDVVAQSADDKNPIDWAKDMLDYEVKKIQQPESVASE